MYGKEGVKESGGGTRGTRRTPGTHPGELQDHLMIRPTCERLENEVGLEHPLEIKEFQHAPDSVRGSNGCSEIISALK